VHAQHDDSDFRIALDDLRCGIDAVELRHGDIHHHDIGRELFGHSDRLPSIGGFADHFDGGIGLQQKPQTFPNDSVIVGHEYSGNAAMISRCCRHLSAIGRFRGYLHSPPL
jgi:hypothetical protein